MTAPRSRSSFGPRRLAGRLLLAAALPLAVCAPALAQSPAAAPYVTYPEVEYPDATPAVEDPTDIETDLDESFAQAGAIFPDFQLPGRAAYEKFKLDLYDRAGIKFAFGYSQLYQYATGTLPFARDDDQALGGFAAVDASWTPIDRGGPFEGTLNFRYGWRNPLGDYPPPAAWGAPVLGSIWSNYEFTEWTAWRVEDLFWEQQLGSQAMLRIGNQGPQALYNFSRFKDARTSFTASPFAFQEQLPYPTFGFGIAARVTPVANSPFYIVGTINDMNGDPAGQGLDWATFFDEKQYFYGAEVGYRWLRADGSFDHLHLDVFYADERSTRLPNLLPNEAGGGFRVYGEKQLGRTVLTGGYTFNTAEGGGISTTFADHTATAAVAYLNPFNIRGEAALGAMWSSPIENILAPLVEARDQFGLEAYWRMQVTPNLSVTPGAQFIINPAFNPDEAVTFVPHIKFRALF